MYDLYVCIECVLSPLVVSIVAFKFHFLNVFCTENIYHFHRENDSAKEHGILDFLTNASYFSFRMREQKGVTNKPFLFDSPNLTREKLIAGHDRFVWEW